MRLAGKGEGETCRQTRGVAMPMRRSVRISAGGGANDIVDAWTVARRRALVYYSDLHGVIGVRGRLTYKMVAGN
uniref:Uncharacterized protein n=1 Tax=Plectus sambesii TaxID=2011161 RepID=A0A914V6S6_9BILA